MMKAKERPNRRLRIADLSSHGPKPKALPESAEQEESLDYSWILAAHIGELGSQGSKRGRRRSREVRGRSG